MGNIIYALPLDISSCGLQIQYKRYLKKCLHHDMYLICNNDNVSFCKYVKDFFVMCHMQNVNNDDGFKVILMGN